MRRLAAFAKRVALIAVLLGPLIYASVLAFAIYAPLPERLYVSDSTLVEWADGAPAHVFLAPDGRWRIPAEIDATFEGAVIRLEDKRFYAHGGVDWIAVLRSTWINLKHGKVITGASTITMQLVRLLEKRPRTLKSKIVEAFRAWQIEHRLGKARILREYLRFTPYGRNVEGANAGSWSYFGHAATRLTAEEAATLLAVPQGPSTRAPGGERTRVLRRARDQIGAWLGERIAGFEAFDPGAEVPDTFKRLPREAPHAARWLAARHPNAQRIRTTLDAQVQAAVEGALEHSAASLYAVGISNMAAIVVDRRTHAVKALAATPHPDQTAGQIAPFSVERRLPPDLEAAVGKPAETPLQIAANAAGGVRLSDTLAIEATGKVSPGAQAIAQRDAWAVVQTERWVVVLWLGNLSHAKSPALVDAVAAPVVDAVARALRGRSE